MSRGDDDGVLGLEGAPAPLRLSNLPLRDEGWTAWATLAVLTLIAAAAGFFAHSLAMGGLLWAALMMAAWRLWAPVRFDIGPTGVTQTVLGRSRTVPWTRIARFDLRPRGVLLLGDDDRSPLASFHGLYIHWGRQRPQLLGLLQYYLEPPDTEAMKDSTRTSL